MRIRVCISDLCSSVLILYLAVEQHSHAAGIGVLPLLGRHLGPGGNIPRDVLDAVAGHRVAMPVSWIPERRVKPSESDEPTREIQELLVIEIGRASCRERVCQYV